MILGITGTLAAGKDTMADYLVEKKGFQSYSLSDELRAEADRQGQGKDRDSLYEVGRKLRAEAGPGVLAMRVLEHIRQDGASLAIVISIRLLVELEVFLMEKDFKLLDIDAPLGLRYKRIQLRGSEKDVGISLQKFKNQEDSENSGGPAGLELDLVRAKADFSIDNSGSLDTLYEHLDEIIEKLKANLAN
jgi:dephospho-CoA kinase